MPLISPSSPLPSSSPPSKQQLKYDTFVLQAKTQDGKKVYVPRTMLLDISTIYELATKKAHLLFKIGDYQPTPENTAYYAKAVTDFYTHQDDPRKIAFAQRQIADSYMRLAADISCNQAAQQACREREKKQLANQYRLDLLNDKNGEELIYSMAKMRIIDTILNDTEHFLTAENTAWQIEYRMELEAKVQTHLASMQLQELESHMQHYQ